MELDARKVSRRLEAKGYRTEVDGRKIRIKSTLSMHTLSCGWADITFDGKNAEIVYGTSATIMAWCLFFASGLVFIARALTIDDVNRKTYSDAYEAVYKREPRGFREKP